jgi:hypothetical protein
MVWRTALQYPTRGYFFRGTADNPGNSKGLNSTEYLELAAVQPPIQTKNSAGLCIRARVLCSNLGCALRELLTGVSASWGHDAKPEDGEVQPTSPCGSRIPADRPKSQPLLALNIPFRQHQPDLFQNWAFRHPDDTLRYDLPAIGNRKTILVET